MIEKATGQHRRPPLKKPLSYDIYDGGPLPGKPGISGYDPEEPEMRGVFMARGPGKYKQGSIRSYHMHCDVTAFRKKGVSRFSYFIIQWANVIFAGFLIL